FPCRVDLVCFICFELPPDKFLSAFTTDLRSRLLPIDAYSDYLKWNVTTEYEGDHPLAFFDSDVTNIAHKAINQRCSVIKSDGPVKVAIAIDCISKVVLKSVSHTCQILHRLSQSDKDNSAYHVEQVVSIVHSDLHESHTLHALSSIASSVLFILPYKQTRSQAELEHGDQSEELENYCKTLHIRKTGRILKRKQIYMINNQLELTEYEEEEWTPKPKVEPIAEMEPSKTVIIKSKITISKDMLWSGGDSVGLRNVQTVDALSNLTFNLKLTKQEEQARANTHLPYMHHTKGAQVQIHESQVKESQIFYQPDDADFDEDDPDDDLDI
ncbi:hypothetical protein QZH41_015362, partial [Actinostola sp. cb2023]